MHSILKPLFGVVCAVAAAGATGYCAFTVGPDRLLPKSPILVPPTIDEPAFLHPFSVEAPGDTDATD